MFFNVREVRDYLLRHGYVFSLRKPRKSPIMRDLAVHGSRYNHKRIGPVTVILADSNTITTELPLIKYVDRSGLYKPSLGIIRSSEEWLALARKISNTDDLRLYFVKRM